jgi:hypothetical protein
VEVWQYRKVTTQSKMRLVCRRSQGYWVQLYSSFSSSWPLYVRLEEDLKLLQHQPARRRTLECRRPPSPALVRLQHGLLHNAYRRGLLPLAIIPLLLPNLVSLLCRGEQKVFLHLVAKWCHLFFQSPEFART